LNLKAKRLWEHFAAGMMNIRLERGCFSGNEIFKGDPKRIYRRKMMRMGQSIFTIADIIVEPYKFNKILDFKIVRELNEHARLYIEGIVRKKDGSIY
jgi:hypothetical protein